jgi:hypothetical protein
VTQQPVFGSQWRVHYLLGTNRIQRQPSSKWSFVTEYNTSQLQVIWSTADYKKADLCAWIIDKR